MTCTYKLNFFRLFRQLEILETYHPYFVDRFRGKTYINGKEIKSRDTIDENQQNGKRTSNYRIDQTPKLKSKLIRSSFGLQKPNHVFSK